MQKKVIITGATGLIGKEAIEPLKKANFDIYALTISENNPDFNVKWINCNLFDKKNLQNVFAEIQPSHLLNFAWTTTDDYLTSDINFKFFQAGLDLLKFFSDNGGKKAVFAGTCFEYKFKNEPLRENDKTDPQTTYAKCKNDLRKNAELFCNQNNISFGWGRIFYVYGINEHKKRLTAHMIDSFKNSKEVVIKSGELIRDYMFSKDIAAAFVKFLDSEVNGIVNICTGNGITIADFATIVAKKLNGLNLLKILNEPTTQPKIIIGDNSRLTNEVGYKLKHTTDEAIDIILKSNN
jgi:nucleoside-diphosphate-sugar epimerase